MRGRGKWGKRKRTTRGFHSIPNLPRGRIVEIEFRGGRRWLRVYSCVLGSCAPVPGGSTAEEAAAAGRRRAGQGCMAADTQGRAVLLVVTFLHGAGTCRGQHRGERGSWGATQGRRAREALQGAALEEKCRARRGRGRRTRWRRSAGRCDAADGRPGRRRRCAETSGGGCVGQHVLGQRRCIGNILRAGDHAAA
jgi:hypothetical protein